MTATDSATHAFDVTLDDFSEKVVATSHQVPVVIDFWAEWCAPCRALKPLLEKLAVEYGGRFKLARINSDENQPLAAEFGVRSIPAVKVVVDGAVVDEFVGVLPESKLREFLDRCLPSPAEPLRDEARARLEGGDAAAALRLLEQASMLDPRSEVIRLELAELLLGQAEYERAEALLADDFPWRDESRVDALHARLALARNAPSESIEALMQQVEQAPDALDQRLRLANGLAQARRFRDALAQLLEIVRRDRHWNEEAGRKAMLNLFNLLGADPGQDDLVREFRVALARTLH